MNEYLNYFIAARNTTNSTALGVLALVIPRYRADKFVSAYCYASEELAACLVVAP